MSPELVGMLVIAMAQVALAVIGSLWKSSETQFRAAVDERFTALRADFAASREAHRALEQRQQAHELSDAALKGQIITRDYFDSKIREFEERIEKRIEELVRLKLENSGAHRVVGGGQ